MPKPEELLELVASLKNDLVLITYHGTTLEQAAQILKHGFKKPNLFEILMRAYELKGLTREIRRQLPPWALEHITADWSPRLEQNYQEISFAPHGIASRWAGQGGEVLHEMVKRVNEILAFMKSEWPKTADGFDAWCDATPTRFYERLGDPVVLKAWVKGTPERAQKILKKIERDMAEYPLEIAWQFWNFEYRDDRVSDPSLILRVEMADPPFTGQN